ncbi:gephyrin-like molybdotransferase Glp [Methylovirgula sp. HY1]|uniref:molybdopterin molybdotransferase MoeA n=1 Tax=Methylovirgula sp. HY1 TaxID=2822761 RepID=UPI001C5AE156|nr:gephyrin-like molybdotransferase Glp [Methylovirgula sp. HY1]QXX73953.1 Molybdopterin molybdenumtransferase [Methylovirgula sp. HY1]
MSNEKPLSVTEARARILAAAPKIPDVETVALTDALGRTLAVDLAAKRTQPPIAVSAMDGYALRAADVAQLPAQLTLIGESAAGHGFAGLVDSGECVRIFTGAPVPQGADAVLMQEYVKADGTTITPQKNVPSGDFIRAAGLDFSEGDRLLPAGAILGPVEIALAAAMDHATLPVVRRPRIAILATGDELVRPGQPIGPDQIVASNSFAIAAYVQLAGGVAIDLGIAGDDFAALEAGIKAARDAKADVLVTLGGASVGDHDLVKSALTNEGMELGFWRIAMRPGRPLIHGRLGDMLILGLPGNPVSAIVCGVLFLLPLVRALNGEAQPDAETSESAILGAPLRGNDSRQDFLRATLRINESGVPVATPLSAQDSSLLRVMAQAQCLVVRMPQAPEAKAGDPCRIIRLPKAGM